MSLRQSALNPSGNIQLNHRNAENSSWESWNFFGRRNKYESETGSYDSPSFYCTKLLWLILLILFIGLLVFILYWATKFIVLKENNPNPTPLLGHWFEHNLNGNS
jgi:hypothetical protein